MYVPAERGPGVLTLTNPRAPVFPPTPVLSHPGPLSPLGFRGFLEFSSSHPGRLQGVGTEPSCLREGSRSTGQGSVPRQSLRHHVVDRPVLLWGAQALEARAHHQLVEKKLHCPGGPHGHCSPQAPSNTLGFSVGSNLVLMALVGLMVTESMLSWMDRQSHCGERMPDQLLTQRGSPFCFGYSSSA